MIFGVCCNFIFLYGFLIQNVDGTAIITLQNKSHITCVVEDFVSPIFLSPPIVNWTEEASFIQGKWNNDDWHIANATDSLHGMITDRRWQGFQTIRGNFVKFLSPKSASFSVYSPVNLRFFINNEKTSRRFPRDSNTVNKWIHYSIICTNNKVYYLKNGHIIGTLNDFLPLQIVVKTTHDTYWKVHDYSFKFTYNVTEEEPAVLTVQPTERSCLLLYVSLCKMCSLDISVTGDRSNYSQTINSSDEYPTVIVKPWQTYVLKLEADKETHIEFYRKHKNFSNFGYWAIDIRKCPKVEHNRVIYRAEFDKEIALTCKYLRNQNKMEPQENAKSQDNCKAGLLGENCNINCSTILGYEFSKCKEHRICQNSKCVCAWGYQGRLCEQKCEDRTWGLSCQNNCKSNCRGCNSITGICDQNSPRFKISYVSEMRRLIHSSRFATIILLGIVILLIMCFGYVVYYSLFSKSPQKPADTTPLFNRSSSIH